MRWTYPAVFAAALLAFTSHARGGDSGAPPAPLSPAQQNMAFVADARGAFEPLKGKLEALGEWCGTSSLFLQRAHIAETLLAFDPENERARLWLRYKRQKDGTWQQTSTRAFSDDNPDALPEWKTRRAEVEGPVREALMPMLDHARWETAGGRTWLVRALLAMEPDDADLHDRAGEALVAKRWILKESAATVEGRRKLREATRKAVQTTASATIVHPAAPGWTSTSKLDLVTVRANASLAEADEIAVRSSQAIALLRLVLGEDLQSPNDLQIMVLAPTADKLSFLSQRSARSAADRDFLARSGGVDYLAKQGGFWLSWNEYGCAMYAQPDRVDSVVREVFNSMKSSYGFIYQAPPCLYEGMGMYLTYGLGGTRLTTLHEKSSYSNQADLRALADGAADWNAILRDMIGRGFDPKLPAVLTSPLNSLTKEDGVVAYVLASYFLEGRGGDLREILVRMHAGATVHQAVAEVCGVDAAGLQDRFVRWLRETGK